MRPPVAAGPRRWLQVQPLQGHCAAAGGWCLLQGYANPCSSRTTALAAGAAATGALHWLQARPLQENCAGCLRGRYRGPALAAGAAATGALRWLQVRPLQGACAGCRRGRYRSTALAPVPGRLAVRCSCSKAARRRQRRCGAPVARARAVGGAGQAPVGPPVAERHQAARRWQRRCGAPVAMAPAGMGGWRAIWKRDTLSAGRRQHLRCGCCRGMDVRSTWWAKCWAQAWSGCYRGSQTPVAGTSHRRQRSAPVAAAPAASGGPL